MAKTRVNISIDEDVLQFIDGMAKQNRMERSAYINWHFAEFMKVAKPPDAPHKDEPAPKRPRKGQG